MTVRNLVPALARAIRSKADEVRSSINRTVISLLEKALGISRRHEGKRIHDDLDHLAGAWTEDEAIAFHKALQTQRTIDAELWK